MSEIKFISYSGGSDEFCCGQLEVEIDGMPYTFGSVSDGDDFERFWSVETCERDACKCSHCTWKRFDLPDNLDDVWLLWYKPHPKWVKELIPELLKVMNENVKNGYCERGC